MNKTFQNIRGTNQILLNNMSANDNMILRDQGFSLHRSTVYNPCSDGIDLRLLWELQELGYKYDIKFAEHG